MLVGPRPPHSLLSQLYADAEANLTSSGAKKDDAAADATGAGAPLLEGKDKEADTKTVLPGGAAGAAAGAAADTFKNMFSEEKLAKVMTNMAMVPMFCILITFCRLRARVDLETEPQDQAKLWMLISTICLFVQVRQPLDSRLWLHVNIQPYCPPYTYPVQRGLRYPFANLSARSP